MQKSVHKDYSENLAFIKDRFNEVLSNILQNLIYAMDLSVVNNIDFKHFIQQINEYESETESQIFNIIIRYSPNSKDLRLLLGILKSLNDLERISKTINRISKVFIRYGRDTQTVDINLFSSFEEMGKRLIIMLKQLIDISSTTNVSNEEAELFRQQLTQADDYIDNLFKDIYKILIDKICNEANSKQQAKLLAKTILVVRHMERLGDHLCKIAEKILYIETGTHFSIS